MPLNCGVREDPESPLDCKEIQPIHPKGSQSWIFIGRTGVEAETPVLWPPDSKSWCIWKDSDWRQEEKWTTEDEIVGWHHQLDGCEVEKASGVGDGQGSLVCYIPWGRKESDMTEWLNWDKRQVPFFLFSPCKDNSLLKHYCCVVRTTSWMFWPLSSR